MFRDRLIFAQDFIFLKLIFRYFEDLLKVCKKYNAVILDKTNKSYVIQITALRREIDVMSKNLKKFGLVSVSRTGAVAMTRGSEVFK